MASSTYDGRARRARLHKANSVYWMAIGRTTPWPDENKPPEFQPGDHTLDEPIVYVRPTMVSLAKLVNSGEDCMIGKQKYSFVADADAQSQQARFIYVKGVFNPALGMPVAGYRQRGIFTELITAAGHEDDQWLAPENVVSYGVMEYCENTDLRSLSTGEQRVIEIVLEFK